MIQAFRIIEDQSRIYSYLATTSTENAEYIETLLEETKPLIQWNGYHRLIAAPFRYPLPAAPRYQARFRPPYYNRNLLYCSGNQETALYEHTYHFLRERIHLKTMKEPGQRTIFSLFLHPGDVRDIRTHPNIAAIMNRTNYEESHRYIQNNPDTKILCYPSCRDPQNRENYAVFEITSLGKNIETEKRLSFYFDAAARSIRWLDINLLIAWETVA